MKKKWFNDTAHYWVLFKWLRIMKLTLFVLLITFIHVSASVYSQQTKLSVSHQNETIREILKDIEDQSEFFFLYKNNEVDVNQKVSINLQDRSITSILDQLFEGTEVKYEIHNRQIVLVNKSLFKQNVKKNINGNVSDSSGAPLPGVSIVIKGTTTGTISDFDGNFNLTNVPGDATLVFSFVGMQTQELAVAGQTNFNITLEEDAIGIEEVIAIGYGSVKKTDLTGSVAHVNLSEMKDRPVRDVVEAMQGNIPGVTIVSNGGSPDKEASIRIRGIGTLSNEAPLWVVDGSVASGPVNPSDIETITILKDASSAAIYGARAAAGVVMVTTKKGKKGKPVIRANSYYGVQNTYNMIEPLNSAQMADTYNMAADNAGLPRMDVFNESLNPDARITRTDWMNEVFRTGTIQRHDVSVSGGSDNASFLVSGGYFKNDAIMLNTYKKDYNLRINSEMKVSDKITFGENISIGSSASQSGATNSSYSGSVFTAMAYPPSAKVYFDEENGIYGGVTDPDSQWTGSYGDLVNPVAQLERMDNKTDNLRIGGNLFLEYEIIKGLTFKSNFGLNYNMSTTKGFGVRKLEPGKIFAGNGLSYNNAINLSWVAEQTLTYKTEINEIHDLTAMFGYTAQENSSKGFAAWGYDFQNEDEQYRYFANAGRFDRDPTDYRWENSIVSYLGRITYGYKDKYLLTANVRADGTSKLMSTNRWGIYPAISGAWRISKENFLEDHPFISDLKLRASWGQMGNLGALGNYATNVNLSKITALLGETPDKYTGYAMNGISNPDLQWETSTQTDIGLDLSLLNNQVDVTVDYFNKQTDDMLMGMAISGLAGVSDAPWGNVGSVKNSGIEFAVNYREKKGDFTYTIGANIAHIKNEVVTLGEEDFIHHGDGVRGILNPIRTQVGSPLYSYYVYKNDGIFQNDAEVQAHTNSQGALLQPLAKAGDLKFLNLNNDDVLDDDDRYIAGDAWPDFTFGLNGTFEYKNWDLSIFLQGATGVELFNGLKYTAYKPTQGYNLDSRALDAWSPTNTGSDIPILSLKDENQNYGTTSDWYVEDASYMRLKNLTIGYSFPKGTLNKCGLGGLRIYLSSQNLLTLTKYTGLDPEVGGKGIDQGMYPQSRTFIIGVNLNL